jgi:hypothetical protein
MICERERNNVFQCVQIILFIRYCNNQYDSSILDQMVERGRRQRHCSPLTFSLKDRGYASETEGSVSSNFQRVKAERNSLMHFPLSQPFN